MMTRRTFVASSAALSMMGKTMLAATGRDAKRLYIGTANSGAGKGILTAPWNAATGEIGQITLAAEVISPAFLAQHHRPDGETLIYAVSEVGGPDARVSALITQPGTAELKLLNHVGTGGSGPTHLSVSPDGNTVLVANYNSGSVSSFLVKPDGSLSDVVSHFQFSGSGPYKGRQETPHTHSAVPSPDGKYALVNDLGLDRVMIYHLNSATAEMTPNDPPYWSGKPGTGPRHMAWNPNGHFVYCSNELDSTVDVLQWKEDPASLTSLQHLSTLPAGFAPNTAFVGEIVASADGRNVYAGNRVADDTIAVFNVDRTGGRLTQAQLAPSGGKNSRHIALDPTDRWMVVSHQNSNDLTVLARDGGTGRLSEPRHSYPVTKPMCVIFV